MRLISATLVLLSFGPVFAQDWIEYVNRAEFFSVNFPGEPTAEDVTYRTGTGASLPARAYVVDAGPRHYAVTVVQYAGAEEADLQNAIADAAELFRRRDGEVTYDEVAGVDGIDGHMLQMTTADQARTYVSMNLHMDRLYLLEATVPRGSVPPGRFQQSLTILDELGRRIRYGTDDDGNKYRVIPGRGAEPFVE